MITPLTRTMIRLFGRASARLGLSAAHPGTTGRGTTSPSRADLDRLSRNIILPSILVTDEEMARAAFQDRGLYLARQEMWDQLAQQIRQADHDRTATPGGESAAMLLAFGARSDVISMAEDALHDGVAPTPDGIDAFESVALEYPGAYPIQLIVALAHLDMFWAWHAIPGAKTLDSAPSEARHHAGRAHALLEGLCGFEEDAPSLVAAQCALSSAPSTTASQHESRIADHFEDLIDLDPASPRHMRALGAALLPARMGSYRELELEARRTAARTGDFWGAGAYTWVYFDALAQDAGALTLLDPAFFVDGLHDILRRCPDQHSANLLAAFCAVTMRADVEVAPAVRSARTTLHDSLTWILRDHLHELHPLIWTQALHRPGAAPLPSRKALISEGRRTALHAIAALFADDIGRGQSIAFSPSGMYMLPSP